MKKAEDIFNLMCEEMPWSLVGKNVIKPYIIEAIKIAQIDTIEETVKLCAENVSYEKENFVDRNNLWDFRETDKIDIQSILNCA